MGTAVAGARLGLTDRAATISLPGGDSFTFGPLDMPATVAWVWLVTNAINLLDGHDGVAAGITALTLSAARGLSRYGVRANAIAPRARTAMTADVFGEEPDLPAGELDPLSPEHVVELVRYLASAASDAVNAQLFVVYGPQVAMIAAPTVAGRFAAAGSGWAPGELAGAFADYFAEHDPADCFSVMGLLDE